MSVLHLMGASGDGGAETYFVDLVGALARAEVSQTCAIRPHPARQAALAAAGVPVSLAPFGGPFDLTTGPRLAQLARTVQPTVIVQWMNRAGRFAPKGPWTRIGRLGGYYDLKYYKGCDLLVGNTEDIVDWLVREGWPKERACHIPNFAAERDEPALDRARLDTPMGAPLILSMGRLHAAKAHDVSLKALAKLPEAYLWIAGTGPLEAELKTLAAKIGVADRVRFLGWRTDAGALYHTADVCAFPSRYEPLGNVVIQAWAHGLPIVAAASQGPGDLIRDGVDGRLTPVDDVDAFTGALRELIDQPKLRAALAAEGRARVARDFSEAAVVARWREVFARFGEPV
jgi:glycosyltransferase involved in cell wall biosynthesis